MKSKTQQINQIKENLTSTARAIISDESVQIEFSANRENNFFSWNQDLIAREKVISSPQTAESISGSLAIKQSRAAIDLASCYLMFHNSETHQEKDLNNPEDQDLFDFFEKIRVTTLVKDSYRGIAKNILEKIEDDIQEGDLEGVAWNSTENLPLILLEEFFPKKILPRTKSLIQNLQRNLDEKLVKKIKDLSNLASDQSGFASSVEEILELMKQIQEAEEKNKEGGDQEDENGDDKNSQIPDHATNFGQENVETETENNPSSGREESESLPQKEEKEISEFKEDEDGGSSKIKSEKTSQEEDKIEFRNAYKIFTSKFDEVVFPQKLVQKNDLEMLRDQLDLKMVKLKSISKKMSLKLKRKLMAKKNSYIERDNSSGVLDRKKLTQFVLDPFIEDIWVDNKQSEYQDTALTILLDNSGSMRGNPIVMSALACEIIAEILEKFSIKTEIIGFTTSDWKGGRARKMWEGMGRPENPGRLNELRHIIYKSSNQSFKKAKVNLGLMLKEGILKENIDGEALLFAKARLMQRDEKRKILMVISDGTPIDDSTNSTNSEDILSDHLHHVISKLEKQSKIEVVGVGIGHSTGDFYKNSISIKDLSELGDVMIEKLADLL